MDRISKQNALTWMLLLVATVGTAPACGDDDDDDASGDGDADTDADADADADADTDADTDGDTDADGDADFECTGAGEETDVAADITTDTRWLCGNTYFLTQIVFVTDGATLTVEPGATVLGDPQSALIVTRGAELQADGLPDHPIVFSSSSATGERLRGDWGGVVLLGDAPINVPDGHVEGIDDADDRGSYGGDVADGSCGTLRHVRIEFAGYAISPDNELNGLTVAGCGSGTTLDHIQIHMGNDDGIEFFGGTASIRHLLITRPQDDGLDWDQGWSGDAQFVIVQQDTDGVAGDKAIEADNLHADNDAEPRSSPRLYNVTLIGSANEDGTQAGPHLRRGTAGEIGNAILMDFPVFGLNVTDAATVAQWEAGALSIASALFFGVAFPADDDDGGFDEAAELGAEALGNVFDVDPLLGAPHSLTAPDFAPAAGSPAAAGVAPPAGLDASATYLGAVEPGSVSWTDGWTAYPEN